MKALTKQTANVVAQALISAYKDARDQAAWWDERAQRPFPPEHTEACRRWAHESVRQHADAIRELAQEAAPWVPLMDECRSLFDQHTDTSSQENA